MMKKKDIMAEAAAQTSTSALATLTDFIQASVGATLIIHHITTGIITGGGILSTTHITIHTITHIIITIIIHLIILHNTNQATAHDQVE